MKTIVAIHIALLFIGLVIGFYAKHDFSKDEMTWQVLLLVIPLAALTIIVVLGLLVLISNASAIKYFFWFVYLFSAFGFSIGIGLIGQSVIDGQVAASSFFTLLGSIGYLVGLIAVAKLQKWRHGQSF